MSNTVILGTRPAGDVEAIGYPYPAITHPDFGPTRWRADPHKGTFDLLSIAGGSRLACLSEKQLNRLDTLCHCAQGQLLDFRIWYRGTTYVFVYMDDDA